MKKLLILLMAAMFLVACGGADKEYEEQSKESEKQLEETKEETKRLEEVSEQIDDTSDLIEEMQEEMGIEGEEEDNSNELDEGEVRELLEYVALSEEDQLIDLVITDGEIKATIEVGDNEIFDDKSMLAEVIYSSAGDEFLQEEGWEVLTIDFIDVGEVSMHRDEKESNEYGDYFSSEEIMKQLGNY